MDRGLRNILYLILLGPFLLTGIVFVLRGIRSTSSRDERERFRYVLIAAIIGVFTGIAELLRFLIGFIPPVGHLGCLAYSSILGISIFKHRKAYDVLAQMQMKLESLGGWDWRSARGLSRPMAGAWMQKIEYLKGLNLLYCCQPNPTGLEEKKGDGQGCSFC